MRLIPTSLLAGLLKDEAAAAEGEEPFDADAALARYMQKKAAGQVEIVSQSKTDRAYSAPRRTFGRKTS